MKIAPLFLILFCFSMSTLGQVQTNSTTNLSSYGDGVNMRVIDMPARPQDLDHSIYIKEDWSTGDVLLENNRVIKKCSLKYDIANGFIEIVGKNSIKAVPESEVIQFSFEDNDFTRWFMSSANFNSEKKIKNSLMEVLVDGNIKLLLNSKISIVKPSGGFSDQRRAGADAITSIREDNYYLTQGEQIVAFDNKKQALAAFGSYKEAMSSWAKMEKLKFGRQEDLITIVNYYADLVESD